MKILVVNNKIDEGEELVNKIDEVGYSVLSVFKEDELIKLFKKYDIAVVIINKNKNIYNILDVCSKASFEKTSYVYKIIISENTDKTDRISCYKNGGDQFLPYPFDFLELQILIDIGLRISKFKKKIDDKTEETVENIEEEKSQDRKQAGADSIEVNDFAVFKISIDNKIIPELILKKSFRNFMKKKLSEKDLLFEEFLYGEKIITNVIKIQLQVAAKRKIGKKFGKFLINKGYTNPEQVQKALEQQASEYKNTSSCSKISKILINSGIIEKKDYNLLFTEFSKIYINKSGKLLQDIEPKEADESHRPKKEDKNKIESDALLHNETEEKFNTTKEKNVSGKKISIVISKDKSEAKIEVPDDLSKPLTMEDIKNIISRNNLLQGVIDDSVILNFIENYNNENSSLIVAKGFLPVLGKDARIEYFFDADYKKAGKELDDGSIDYKDRGLIPHVKKGDILAKKHYIKPAKPGSDVFGNIIEVTPVKDAKLLAKAGAAITSDNQIIATIDGKPGLTIGGAIIVSSEYIINGDVDYNTGNINFDGDIIVKGKINNGFSVKGNNLKVVEIFGADIDITGDLLVSGGIINSKTKNEGTVKSKFLKSSNIKSFGDITVLKEVIESKVRTSGRFICKTGKIISSFISAKAGVYTKDIGTEISKPCKIAVGKDDQAKKMTDKLMFNISVQKESLNTHNKEYEANIKIYNDNEAEIAKHAHIQDRSQIQKTQIQKKLDTLKNRKTANNDFFANADNLIKTLDKSAENSKNTLALLFNKQDDLEKKNSEKKNIILKLTEDILSLTEEKNTILKWMEQEKGNPEIKITGEIFPKTAILGTNSSLIIENKLKKITIKEVFSEETDWQMVIKK